MNQNTSWGGVSGWYDELLTKQEGTYQKDLILPNLLRLLAPKPGEAVLDLACGQGFFSREIEKTGAKVIGADIAKELIAIAERNMQEDIRRSTPQKPVKPVEFHVAPSDKLTFCPTASVDKVIIILALQNIENIAGTLEECNRVLKINGKLIIVLNHPAFRIPKHSSWQWDADGGSGAGQGEAKADMLARGAAPRPHSGKQFRRVDAYMSEIRERIEMNPGEGRASSKKFTVSFHRPLQVYFKAFAKAGFAVSRLEEWVSHKRSVAGGRAEEENRIRKEIPMFLFLEAIKKGV